MNGSVVTMQTAMLYNPTDFFNKAFIFLKFSIAFLTHQRQLILLFLCVRLYFQKVKMRNDRFAQTIVLVTDLMLCAMVFDDPRNFQIMTMT